MEKNSDKTLLLICGTLESGGAERVISILTRPLADYFARVWILTWRRGPQFYEIDSRIKVISLNDIAGSSNFIKKGIAYRKLLYNLRPSCVLSFLTPFNMLSLLYSSGVNIPKLVAERNDPRFIKGGRPIALIRDILYRSADKILCQTPSIKEQFNKHLGKKVEVIYNPVIMDESQIGSALSQPKKKKVVCVARLHPQKNHKLLLDSFKLFLENHEDYTLELYGDGDCGPMLAEYIKYIGIENSVRLIRAQKNVHDLIANATMFVMTSKYEGMPNALIEAMCLGLPCISTPVSGAIDLINTNENGIIVNPDVHEVANAMSYIAENPFIAKNIGSNATKLYHFLDVDKISKEWVKCISQAIR